MSAVAVRFDPSNRWTVRQVSNGCVVRRAFAWLSPQPTETLRIADLMADLARQPHATPHLTAYRPRQQGQQTQQQGQQTQQQGQQTEQWPPQREPWR